MHYQRQIQRQYKSDNLSERILEALRAAGKEIGALTRGDLVPFDEFHIGGQATTRRLTEMLSDVRGKDLLDIGCGIGGPSRTLAAELDATVVGIDITLDYCRAAAMLSRHVGMSDRTCFVGAAAPDLPFADQSFDMALLQHVSMNVMDKDHLFAEIRRVLRPNGHLVMHEVFSDHPSAIRYPVFWADDPGVSFIESQPQARARLERQGFSMVHWQDLTGESAEWFSRVIRRFDQKGVPPLSLELVVGSTFETKARNVARNLESGAISVVQAVLTVL